MTSEPLSQHKRAATGRGHRAARRIPRALVPLLLFLLSIVTSNAVLGSVDGSVGIPDSVPAPVSLRWPAVPVVPGGTVGTLPGSGSVGPDGQYHYSLPLEVPVGRAEMQPALSLVYASSGGNGPVGVGWQLGGLSSIRQCPMTFATDGKARPVRPGLLDAMCLDGARLIDLSGANAAVPADGTEYRTENESFARILFHAAGPNNPQILPYYEVWAKDGHILRYLAVDSTFTTFPLTVARDRSGNNVTYAYDHAATGGTWLYPTKISYTGRYSPDDGATNLVDHHTDLGARTIILRYEDRPDPVIERFAGDDLIISKRLRSLKMYAPVPGGTTTAFNPAGSTPVTPALVWTYTLTYDPPSGGTGRSLLRGVERTGALGGREYDKVFHWQSTGALSQALSYTPTSVQLFDLSTIDTFHPFAIDVDGDGRDEVIAEVGDGNILLYWSSGATPLSQLQPLPGLSNATLVDAHFADVNGDGIPELIAPDRNADTAGFRYYRIYHWSPSARDYVDPSPSAPLEIYVDGNDSYPQENPLYLVDLDGDGLPDLIKADHALDDPYVDESRKSVNQPAGLVFNWSRRRNVGGTFAPEKSVFIQSSPANHHLNLLATPTSASPFGAFGINDGSGAAQLIGMNIWIGVEPFDWSTVHPGAVNITTPAARLAASWQDIEPWAGSVDVSSDTGVPGKFFPFPGPTTIPNGIVPLQGDAFTSTTSWLCAIGNFDGRTPRESYCFDPLLDLPGQDLLEAQWRVRSADLDGDGRDDLIVYHYPLTAGFAAAGWPSGDWPFTKRPASDAVPDATYRLWFDAAGQKHLDPLPSIPIILGDFDGDGRLDLIGGTASRLSASKATVQLADWTSGDLLDEVWDEDAPRAAEIVTYAQRWSQPPASSVCTFPEICLHRALNVVEHHAVYQGADVDQYRNLYFGYDDPRYDVHGRGFLGFGEVREWDAERPSETITLYDNVNALGTVYYAFLPKLVLHYVPTQYLPPSGRGVAQPVNVRITQITTHYAIDSLNGGRNYFRHPTTWTTSESETTATLDATPLVRRHFAGFGALTSLRAALGASEFDAYGNVWHATASTVGGVSTEITSIFDYRVNDWLVGLLKTRFTKVAEPGGSPTPRRLDYAHDLNGHLQEADVERHGAPTADPDLWETVVFEHNTDGLVSTVTRYAAGETARATHIAYDPDEGIFPREVWNDLGHTSQLLYHPAFGSVSDTIDPNGVEAQTVYDDLGHPRQAWRAGGTTVSRDYSPRLDASLYVIGTEVSTYGSGLVSSIAALDMLGRPVLGSHAGFDGNWITGATRYDALGRVALRSRPGQGGAGALGTSYLYDSLDRLLQTKLPDNNVVVQWHSFLESHTIDPLAHESFVVRDLDGRVVRSVQKGVNAQPVTTTYAFGDFNLLQTVTDPVGNVTSMSYDQRGRRTQLVDADTGTSSFDYNGFGELMNSQVPDPSGGSLPSQTTFEHDVLGRPRHVQNADGDAYFTWDAPNGIGRLATTTSADNRTTQAFHYDAYGRPSQTTWTVDGESFDVQTGYDALGRVSTIAYPSVPGAGRPRFTVQRSYAGTGYLDSVSEIDGAGRLFWQVLARNADDRLLTGRLGNGLFEGHSYDDATGRLQGITDSPSADLTSPVFALAYAYSDDGLVKSRTDSVAQRTETFDYDPLHRLTGWHVTKPGSPTYNLGYQYDAIGNLTSVLVNNVVNETNYYGCHGSCLQSAIKPHALVSASVGSGPFQVVNNFGYDARGRQFSAPSRQVTFTENDLPQAITTPAGTTSFLYDAAGTRAKKIGPDAGSSTVFIGGLYERRQTASQTQHVFYVPGTDGVLAQVVYDPTLGDSVEYLHRDKLGSASAVSDAAGHVTQRMFYDPFGARVQADTAGGGDVRVSFTGHLADQELGLVDMKGRIYDPKIRHFLSADPFVSLPGNAQSYNRYSYVLNNPVNLVDPSGYWPDDGGDDPDVIDICPYGSAICGGFGGGPSGGAGGPPQYGAGPSPSRHPHEQPAPPKAGVQKVTPPQATPMPAVPSGPQGQAWLNTGSSDFYRQLSLDVTQLAYHNALGGSKDDGGGVAEAAERVVAEAVGWACLVTLCKSTGSPDSDLTRRIEQRRAELAEEFPDGLPIMALTGGGPAGTESGGSVTAARALTRAQAGMIAELRNGQTIYVRNVAEARQLLEHLPELKPYSSQSHLPAAPAPRGTYRGDLLNTRNPGAPFVHEPGTAPPSHAENPHYNLFFQNGKKPAIIIMPEPAPE
jgi:RHS repeat-associated protein